MPIRRDTNRDPGPYEPRSGSIRIPIRVHTNAAIRMGYERRDPCPYEPRSVSIRIAIRVHTNPDPVSIQNRDPVSRYKPRSVSLRIAIRVPPTPPPSPHPTIPPRRLAFLPLPTRRTAGSDDREAVGPDPFSDGRLAMATMIERGRPPSGSGTALRALMPALLLLLGVLVPSACGLPAQPSDPPAGRAIKAKLPGPPSPDPPPGPTPVTCPAYESGLGVSPTGPAPTPTAGTIPGSFAVTTHEARRATRCRSCRPRGARGSSLASRSPTTAHPATGCCTRRKRTPPMSARSTPSARPRGGSLRTSGRSRCWARTARLSVAGVWRASRQHEAALRERARFARA